MGKSGGVRGKSGRRPIYDDMYHKVQRTIQLKYDREIADIRKERNCSYEEAQAIHRVRKREAEP